MFNILGLIKPKLSELIPNGFVDIHSHILPGVDDGAKNISQSLEIISKMNQLGFSKIIGTPHTYPGLYNNTNRTIKDSFDILSKKISKNIDVDYASEYLIDTSLVIKSNEKSLLTLKDKYVLVEMSFFSETKNLFEILFEIQTNGYIPILAHPERYRFLFSDMKKYYKLKDAGCNFQLNLLSLIGYYGNDIVKICDKLLNENLVEYYGSDFHSINHVNEIFKNVKIKNIKKLEDTIMNNQYFI